MLFNSLAFFYFFPVVVCLYFLLPQRFRWAMLLSASYYFYACWKAEYLILIALTTLTAYLTALGMCKTESKRMKTALLWTCLGVSLGVLFLYKYFNLFNHSLGAVWTLAAGPGSYPIGALDLVLPVGISFYTFQTLSYTLDVYRGRQEVERHLGVFALYVSFFPQLVAGPIERSTRLLPQFYEKHSFCPDRAVSGLRIILWGFFKKIVIADRLAVFVDVVYSNPQLQPYQGVAFMFATALFAFQIYCDFSAYSDIAIGVARVMGYDLMVNFNRPYFSKTVGEFWGRWHISLSTWFRDYVYIPLGGNRVSTPRWTLNVMIVFVVSGLWHGANWTFVVWGALHGFYLLMERVTANLRANTAKQLRLQEDSVILKAVGVSRTFVLVGIAWIFFRANTVQDALYMVSHLHVGVLDWLGNLPALATGDRGTALTELLRPIALGLGKSQLLTALGLIATMEGIHLLMRRTEDFADMLGQMPWFIRWTFYYGATFVIYRFGVFGANEFIYFVF